VLRIVRDRDGFVMPRVGRVFVALLVKRYADGNGRPEVLDIARDTSRRGAYGMLREIPGPMLAWRVEVTV
jgi:3-hydroxyacyl-CoA dehydrogenase